MLDLGLGISATLLKGRGDVDGLTPYDEIGTAPFATAMKLVGKQGPNVMTALLIVFSAVLAWALYWLTLPLVLRWLEQRRELILRAVTREYPGLRSLTNDDEVTRSVDGPRSGSMGCATLVATRRSPGAVNNAVA